MLSVSTYLNHVHLITVTELSVWCVASHDSLHSVSGH